MVRGSLIYNHLGGHITVPEDASDPFHCYIICGFCHIDQTDEGFSTIDGEVF